ncbi:hypothetical protein L218DRAFT_1075496 [Marasmius fiardii PR-910]|nr:hypothetical protein L218DRAFT_1075496 [Marasmius fiardii PR-910]
MAFDGQIGALEVGALISMFLFGTSTTQTYLYYQLFPRDPISLKRLVLFVWFLELGHSISATHATYVYTITNFGNTNVPHMKAPYSLGVNLFLSEIVFVSVQGYFLKRITQVSRTWLFTIGCSFLLLVRFGLTSLAFVEAILMTSMDQFIQEWRLAIIAFLTIGSFLDLIIPFAMVYFLFVQRVAAQKTTAAIVDKLILWTVESCFATGFMAVLMLIFFIALPGRFAWMSVYMCLPKVFSNALLAHLNSRVKLRAMQENGEGVELSGSDPAQGVRNTVHFPHRLGAKVNVSTQRVRTIDDGRSKSVQEVMPPGEETSSEANDTKNSVIIM